MLFKKLDAVLDENFRRVINPDNFVYWCRDFTMIGKGLKKTEKVFKGGPYISIESFDTRVFPVEVVFRRLIKTAGK